MATKVFFCGDLGYKPIILKLLSGLITVEETDALDKADLVYCVYGKGPKLNIKTSGFWLGNRQKYILHWIGTDVLSHVNKLTPRTNLRSRAYHTVWNYILKRKTRRKSMVNLCCAPWLCDELSVTGVKADYLPLTTLKKSTASLAEQVRDIDFLSYLPQARMDLYNANEVFRLAALLPGSKFTVIVPDADNASEVRYTNVPANVTFVPKMDHQQVLQLYRRSKIFLRFTQHDGLSLSVIEALANKMHVMWTYPFQHVQHITLPVTDSVAAQAKQLITNWTPNTAGQDFVLSELDSDVVKSRFDAMLNEFLNA